MLHVRLFTVLGFVLPALVNNLQLTKAAPLKEVSFALKGPPLSRHGSAAPPLAVPATASISCQMERVGSVCLRQAVIINLRPPPLISVSRSCFRSNYHPSGKINTDPQISRLGRKAIMTH